MRNVSAVGSRLSTHGSGAPEHPVAVIAAGERWPDGSPHPALEDLAGAGTTDLAPAVATGASGRHLVATGFAEGVLDDRTLVGGDATTRLRSGLGRTDRWVLAGLGLSSESWGQEEEDGR
ncbi:hypothetical protein ABZT06_47830 [Streptomyces sp. NPDC005483]|uniref:hypothetical protein n=1 Tax=Streptomyces sp. NPDC005483 TaxID=3154882 RepID=UPI0033AC3EB0